MPTPPLTDAQCLEALDAFERHHKSNGRAAEELGLPRSTFISRKKIAHQRGLHLSEGARDSATKAGLSGLEVRGGHRRVYDDDGKQIDTVRYNVPQEDVADFADKVRAAFDGLQAAPPIIQSEKSAAGKIAFMPQSDVHLGVEITADRGGVEYSPEIAMERMRDGFSQTHGAIPACETTIILDNGDLSHANDDRDVTPRNEHRLKVTGSHRRNLGLSVTAKAWQIDMGLRRSDRVVYRSNRGNHDPNTPDTMAIALQQRYRDEPRVTIDDSERDTWIYQRGLVFLAAHHGHGIKPDKLAANIPPNFPREFGESRYWYLFTGHLHNPRQDTFGAFSWFQLPAICAMDQHAADMGYSDAAAMRAMMFCERGGLKHDMTVRF